MVTLTTDYGEFQAETEREALALARKAKAAADKAEHQRAADSAAADNAARRTAYHIYYAKHSPQCNKPTWMNLKKDYAPKIQVDDDFWAIDLETADGNATVRFWRSSWNVVGVLWDAGGSQCAVAIRDTSNGKVTVYAVGVHNGVSETVMCPGIAMDDFAKDDVA